MPALMPQMQQLTRVTRRYGAPTFRPHSRAMAPAQAVWSPSLCIRPTLATPAHATIAAGSRALELRGVKLPGG